MTLIIEKKKDKSPLLSRNLQRSMELQTCKDQSWKQHHVKSKKTETRKRGEEDEGKVRIELLLPEGTHTLILENIGQN